MANVQLPTVNTGETNTTELVKQLLNAYIMLTEELTFLLNNLDTRNVNELNADIINAGTINAALVTIKSELQAGAYIAIDGQGMKINDGTQDTFKADINGQVTMTGATVKNNLSSGYIQMSDQGLVINDGTKDTFEADINGQVTMTGAKVQSSDGGYPRVEMNPDEKLFGAYASADNYIQMLAVAVATGSPQFKLVSPVGSLSLYQQANVSDIYGFNSELRISAQRDIYLTPGSPAFYVRVPFEQVLDTNKGTSLFSQLLSKATAGNSTGLSGGHNHGIPDGTVLRTADGGTVTFFAASQHSHSQN